MYTTLGATGSHDDTQAASESERIQEEDVLPDSDGSQTFLRIDGMYSATCEAYLESLAETQSGVISAEASYVTETIRIDHDPATVSKETLRDALSTLGYTAYLRDDASTEADTAGGTTRRSREMGGIRKRRDDQLLGMRYSVGFLFGAFLLVPYVAILYPAQLASIFDWQALAIFEGAFRLDSQGAFVFLRLYFVMTGIILVFTGLPVLRGAYISLKMRRPNTDLLVAITAVSAYLYSTAAVILGQNDIFYDLAIVVTAAVTAMVFYESSIKQRALDRLTELTISQVEQARTYDSDGTTQDVRVEDLEAGDVVLVRQGERVPVDGELVEDSCTVDEAIVTGESLPVVKRAGDDVIGGSIVTDGAALVRVGPDVTSSIDRITTAVWDLQSATHGVQRHADQLASYAVFLVVGAAVTVGSVGALAFGMAPPDAALLALLVLLAGSPWALGLATPLSVAKSLSSALRRGIIIFDETVFERLRDVDIVVFDKTGTLTTGEMEVIEADAPPELLDAVAELEQWASHPAANAIVTAFADKDGGDDTEDQLDSADDAVGTEGVGQIREFTNHRSGIEGVIGDTSYLVGNLDLFAEQGWTVDDDIRSRIADARGFGQLPVVIGRDGAAEGLIVVGDEPRDGWDDTVSRLGERGTEVVVLTGDDEEATDFFKRHDAVTHVFATVPPEGKTVTIRRLKSDGQVAMVGDGTNDAPALAAADLGISLGGGTALAADAADIAIVDNDIRSVETAFDLAGAARRRVKQNNLLAFSYNGIALAALAVGFFNPLTAAAAVIASGGLLAVNTRRKLLG
ncbi:cation-translocating P-type ATPase [Halorubrum ezzemoulense]|uniref:Cation-translocating P-type ATPase n=2 Tax=Halorubrum TaxID=56688 RepID=A0ABT4Z7Z0_HALEZ|nr:cation-translocating P-type ATPase [Halorubrum ezzemoulense]MDB2242579.1 cation-translocating P-type ATPase [Halorubrum ezzemoulense]MDB2246103.1 cation-translocating P-type ATPase [Halorubrum ezzemoulense]MDB2279750.1 cation-translocating P-type ATPase [Halorubrum ezzemoulense]MDB2290176.1 cation-translocating P-type ATPase [Halorubrum ezzemoulense]MDB2294072.1 cation-translocating P-type ATPase [Halorubrum ezzemoulense]